MVGRVHAFQPGGPGSIPGGVRNFNFCVVFGGGPDIVLTTHSGRPALVYLSSFLVQKLLLPLQAIWLVSHWGVSPRLGEGI